MSDANSLIRRAIEEKTCLEGVYAGHRRQLCPHVLGTKQGRPRVLCFQYGGTSSRGLAPGGDWRCLPLESLTEVTSVTGGWRTKPRSLPQTCVDVVELEVEL